MDLKVEVLRGFPLQWPLKTILFRYFIELWTLDEYSDAISWIEFP